MKSKTISICAGVLLLFCVQHSINAQNSAEYPAGGNSVSHAPAPALTTIFVSDQARRIEFAINQRLRTLANVVCHEQIARYAKRGNTTSQMDTLDVNVEVQEGVEKYSEIRRREKVYSGMEKLPGTWSVGEMATLLTATRDALAQGGVAVGQSEAPDLGHTSVISFSYPAESRRWYLKAHSQVHWLAFEGRVWASPETGEIRRISWLANNLPADSGATQVLWTVDFGPVDLTTAVVTLPEKALFEITYRDGRDRVDWNVTRFSEYKQFGSESAIHFDE